MDTVVQEQDRILTQIKQALAEKGLRQIDLAAAMGMNKQTVSARLKGRTQFKLTELIEICDFLGIEIII